MPAASTRGMMMATAFARSMSTPRRASGPYCARGYGRIAASHRRSCRSISASSSSCITPAAAERPCSALLSPPWSRKPMLTTPKPDKSHDKKELSEMVAAMVASPAWKATLEKQGWIDLYQPSDEFAAFLKENQAQVTTTLKD